MKTYLALAVACLSLQSISTVQAQPRQTQTLHSNQGEQCEAQQQRAEIEDVLRSYERALNAGDVKGVMRLYTDDAVLLAPEAPSAVGSDAVRDAYAGTFQAIGLNIAFEIAELKFLSSDWAFLRTNSTGVIKIAANGAQIPEGNQELFLLYKSRGHWKIARYSFSSFLRSAQ